MPEEERRWRRIQEEGTEWEVRVVPGSEWSGPSGVGGEPAGSELPEGEVVEFVCVDGTRKPRRLAVPPGAVTEMDEAALRRVFRQARPIGGDHYGRPGKPASDAGGPVAQ